MKKKLLLICAMLLMITSLICALSIFANATSADLVSVSIDKFNLVFEDNVYLKYAVKFDGVEYSEITAANIGMLYFTAPQSEYAEENKSHSSAVVGFTTIGGQTYYTFEYRHISAKMMTDYIYSVAYIDIDGERYYSAPVKYSVLDYCYAKLGKTGVASENENFKALLSATLEQGTAAQKYFNYKTDRLANAEYYLVEVEGGTLADGFTKGLYHSDETVALTAPETNDGYAFLGWKDDSKNIISRDITTTLNSIESNKTYTSFYVNTCEHEITETLPAANATCTSVGLTEGSACALCHTVLTAQNVIPMAEHNFINRQCTKCGEWDCTGHGVWITNKTEEIITVYSTTNNSSYPFCITDNLLTSTNKTGNSTSTYTITALSAFTLNIEYMVSSESNYDWLTILHNSTQKARISGLSSWASLSIEMQPGDTVKITYSKDGSVDRNDDCAYVKLLTKAEQITCTEQVEFVYVTEENISSFASCEHDVMCDTCGATLIKALGHEYVHHEAKSPTCTDIGWNAYDVCTRCEVSDYEELAALGHNYVGDMCSTCGRPRQSEGLVFQSNGNGTCTVTSNGSCTDTHLVIPSVSPAGDRVTAIAARAFLDGSHITSVEIPDSVTSIGNGAFKNCNNIQHIIIPFVGGSQSASGGSTHFGFIFGYEFVSDSTSAHFYDGSSFYRYYIPEGLTHVILTQETNIVNQAFRNCKNITDITIPSSVTKIGDTAFSSCSGLKNIHIENLSAWCNISYSSNYANPFNSASNLYLNGELVSELVIPEDVTTIKKYTFDGCSTLKSIIIHSGVTSIEAGAFEGCFGLESITIPFVGASRTATDYQAHFGYIFGYSTANSSWHYISTSSNTYYSYHIPASLEKVIFTGETIGEYAFRKCAGLTEISLPESILSIGKYAFDGCSNLQYNEFDNAYYLGNSENPYVCLVTVKKTDITSCIIHENTKVVCYSSFYDCESIVSLTLPFVGESETKNTYLGYIFGASVSSANQSYVPNSLKTVIVTRATAIGAYAFFSCTKITDITLPHSVTTIGNDAFSHCSSLTSITLPSSVTHIGNYAFYGCDGLTEIIIPNGVVSIGGDAFTSCANLTDITIPSSVKQIGSFAFSSCWNLVNVYITDIAAWCNISFGNYGANPFGYADKRNNHLYLNNELVTDLIIPEGVTTIPLYAFHAIDLKSVIIPSTVTTIGESAFADCKQLSSVSFAENSQLSTISTGAFYYCKALSRITIPSTVVSIGSNVFSSCDALYTVTFESAAGWWYASSSSETSGTDISSADLEDTVAAATLLKSTYKSYYWMKS